MWTQIPWPEEPQQCVSLAGSWPSTARQPLFPPKKLPMSPVRFQHAKTQTLRLLNGIQKDTYISINKLGIQ